MDQSSLARIRAELEPSWNDLREQRVLGRVLEANRRARARRRLVAFGGGTATVLAIAAAVVLLVVGRPPSPTLAQPAPVVASATPPPSASAAEPQRIALADGAQASLLENAQLEVGGGTRPRAAPTADQSSAMPPGRPVCNFRASRPYNGEKGGSPWSASSRRDIW